MWFDYLGKMDEEFKDYISHRNIGIGLFLIASGILWTAQIYGILDFQYLMPSLVAIGGIFFLAEGIALRYFAKIKKWKKRRR